MCAGIVPALTGCDEVSRAHDTAGVQTLGRWEWRGRVVVDTDPGLTLERLRVDTAAGGGGGGDDVVLARYEFNPTSGVGDEYALTLAMDLGRARALSNGVRYSFGRSRGEIPAYATVTCLCSPLKLDSLSGTFRLATRGLRHLVGRVDATLYFTEWNDPTRHTSFPLRQRLDAIK